MHPSSTPSSPEARLAKKCSGAASLVLVVWLVAVVLGFGALARYKFEPAVVRAAPSTWPASSELERDASRPSLMMFVHPQCSCSRASVSELAQVMANGGATAQVRLIVAVPEGAPEDWATSSLVESARGIANVEVVLDSGAEAAAFNADVSGQTLLYDSEGSLVFAGGITESRGHEGESRGRRELLAALENHAAVLARAPVFGCELD